MRPGGEEKDYEHFRNPALNEITLASDSIFDGRYRILGPIGEGGMGKVYRAQDIELDRVVAIKLLNSSLIGSDEDVSRFRREGKILSEVQNDSVVKFFSYSLVQGKLPYLVMEFVSGVSLRQLLSEQSRIPASQVLEFAMQIANGLKAVHEKGIVHRDLKPNNVLVVRDGDRTVLKLLDFGLSRVLSSSPVEISRHLTQTGLLIGSVHYMSPEQCRGQKADERADLYSLGCIIYEMLCGELPFSADNPIALLSKHVGEDPRPLEQFTKNIVLPEGISNVISKAMSKDLSIRYQNAEELIRDLRLVIDGKGKQITAVFRQSTIKEFNSIAKKRKFLVPAAIGVTTLALVSLVFFQQGPLSKIIVASESDPKVPKRINHEKPFSGTVVGMELANRDGVERVVALKLIPDRPTREQIIFNFQR